jgi:hypothetical protein
VLVDFHAAHCGPGPGGQGSRHEPALSPLPLRPRSPTDAYRRRD